MNTVDIKVKLSKLKDEEIILEVEKLYINEKDGSVIEAKDEFSSFGYGISTITYQEEDPSSKKAYNVAIDIETKSLVENVIAYEYDKDHQLIKTTGISNLEKLSKVGEYALIEVNYKDSTERFLDHEFNYIPKNASHTLKYTRFEWE